MSIYGYFFIGIGILACIMWIVYQKLQELDYKKKIGVQIKAERPEETGFYECLRSTDLCLYQEALTRIFCLIDAKNFEGSGLSDELKNDITEIICSSANSMGIKPKYLEVMVNQFLATKPELRREDLVLNNWARMVYERDKDESSALAKLIPSAWRICFVNCMQNK